MKRLPILAFCFLVACSNLYNYVHIPGSYIVQPGDTLYSIAFDHGLDARDLAAWNGLGNPNRIDVGQRLVLSPRPAGPVTGPAPAPASRPSVTAPVQTAPAWQWPIRGAIVSAYGDSGALSSGIGIAGREGAGIVAAAAGRVVYAGSGLRDYGQLLIVEHNANWLSAYGHNRRLLVAEGDPVSQGQRIAEMGVGPGGTPLLHFEIRRNGDPVNPLGLLPRE
jgi:lipoprotein NlpD